MISSYVGAYWGDRKESAVDCADHLELMLTSLARIDPALAAWFKKGRSRKTATTPIDTTREGLTAQLRAGVNRRDVGGDIIHELGYSFGAWNGQDPEAGLSAHVGSYSAAFGAPNSVLLSIRGPRDSSLYAPPTARQIFQSVVDAWEPEWATWATDEIRERQGVQGMQPVVGWFTYVSRGPQRRGLFRPAVRTDDGIVQSAETIDLVDDGAIASTRRLLGV